MTHHIFGISAIAIGTAALVSLCPLPVAYADTPGPAGPNAASPSLAEPAPTPGWAEAGPAEDETAAPTPPHRPYVASRHTASRHHVWRAAHRSARAGGNPLADAATGVVGGVADLGSVAAYPLYCFPHYGSCAVRVPYRP